MTLVIDTCENKMKKICFFTGNLNLSGGTERVCSTIANALQEQGYEVSVINLHEGEKPFFPLHKEINNKQLFSKRVSFSKNYIQVVKKLRSFCKTNSIDTLVIVESMLALFSVPALAGLGIKHICWEHFNFNVDLGQKKRRFARQLAARFCDWVVVLTEQDCAYWLQHSRHKGQIVAIPNPLPFPIQDAHTPSQESRIVLSVGRLTPQKGFDLLLAAWKEVAPFAPLWRLRIIGDGEDRAKLQKLCKEYAIEDTVDWIGRTADVATHYREAAIYCLSSRFEGFGMVLLEAMAFSLPCVAFDCEAGPAELLADTGALLVEPENTNKLAQALLYLIQNPQDRTIISEASKIKATQYSINSLIKKWIKII